MKPKYTAEIQVDNNLSRRKVNLTDLKAFASEKLHQDWPLRQILLDESQELDIPTFLARLPVYLRLSKLGSRSRE
jgi:hypothetical protein